MTAQLFAATGATCLPTMSSPAFGHDLVRNLRLPRSAIAAPDKEWQLAPGTACILAILIGAACWGALAVVLLS